MTWNYTSGLPYTELFETYNSRQPEEIEVNLGARNASRLPAYHRMDIAATYTIVPLNKNRESKVGISVFNLYNRKNVRDFRYAVVTDPKRKSPALISMSRNLLGFSPNIFVSIDF